MEKRIHVATLAREIGEEPSKTLDGLHFYGIEVDGDMTFEARSAIIILANSGVGKAVQKLASEKDAGA